MVLDLSFEEKVYADYFEKVTSYVRSHVGNVHDREDVVSEVFLKVYASLERYDADRASLSTWIYTITKNTVIDYYRAHRITQSLEENTSVEEAETLDDDLAALTAALTALDARERDLIILHYFSGYTLKVIAEMMRISYIYAKVLHRKAMNELKKQMEETRG